MLSRFGAGRSDPVSVWRVAHLPLSEHEALQSFSVSLGVRLVPLNFGFHLGKNVVNAEVGYH